MIRDVCAKMVSWIEKFIGVIDVIVQYDPVHLALPWAAILILQAGFPVCV